MGKKTAEAKGKQNEYKRVYRQRKQAGESAEEEKLAWQNEEKRGKKGL